MSLQPRQPAPWSLDLYRGGPLIDERPIVGIDLTGATLLGSIRRYRDCPGDPLVALPQAGPNTEGVSVRFETVEGRSVTWLRVKVQETTIDRLAGLPLRRREQDDLVLWWDALITPSGGDRFRWFEGAATYHPGVTRNG